MIESSDVGRVSSSTTGSSTLIGESIGRVTPTGVEDGADEGDASAAVDESDGTMAFEETTAGGVESIGSASTAAGVSAGYGTR